MQYCYDFTGLYEIVSVKLNHSVTSNIINTISISINTLLITVTLNYS